MQVRKLESTDGFCVVDLETAPRHVGVARVAPKVLVDGAELLARATTYAFALFGVQAGGASVGINAKGDDRDAAVAAALAELGADETLTLWAGTGIAEGELPRPDPALVVGGAVAAASAFGSGTAAVAGPAAAEWADALAGAWSGGSWAGAGDLQADVDVLFVAGRSGIVDDEAAATMTAKVVVPVTPVPVTAKAYATLNRAGRTFVPDALSCAAPLLAAAGEGGGDPVERVAAMAAELAAAGGEPWRVMVDRAERFLSTWQPSLPFGRPLA